MLVKSGKVMLPKNSSETLEFAATELCNFYFESTDLKLSKSYDICCIDTLFSIGKTDFLKKSGIQKDYYLLKEDGFFITEREGIIFIDGNTDASVLYGVYDFLEVYLGIRFFSADTTIVPKTKEFNLPIERFEIPAVDYRAYMSGDCFHLGAVPEFMARSRTYNPFTSIGKKYGERKFLIGRNCSTHNMNYYVPYNVYHSTHPEFYYQREGVIEVKGYNEDGTGCSPNLTVCLTNGLDNEGNLDNNMSISVAKVVIEEFKKDIIENPQAKYFTFEQEDLSYGCECERCLETAKKYKRSGMMIRFCNVIAKELQDWSNNELGVLIYLFLIFSFQNHNVQT